MFRSYDQAGDPVERLAAHFFCLVVGLRLLLGPQVAKRVLRGRQLDDCERGASGGSIFQKKKIGPSNSVPKRPAFNKRL